MDLEGKLTNGVPEIWFCKVASLGCFKVNPLVGMESGSFPVAKPLRLARVRGWRGLLLGSTGPGAIGFE